MSRTERMHNILLAGLDKSAHNPEEQEGQEKGQEEKQEKGKSAFSHVFAAT